ncbi:OmpA family protein [uncultured Dokdonia sp.]|uniref:OmpA family protein n=1 Tax=uncultured Dokdonia sp. TaxID=575653 RepID=UPI002606D969|nr:OmpA family protein [uncultured Dokdonia sp.]
MKGFWGTFLIFLLWATAGIYYIHIKEKGNTIDITAIKAPIEDEIANTTVSKATPEKQTEIKEIPPVSNEITVDTTTTDNSFDEIENNNLYISDNSISDSQLLAEEIKKSIAISDTIDIDKDEPSIEYKKEPLVTDNPNASSQIFYPRYANTDLILDKKLISYATELKKVLKDNPNKKVTIIGHTDNVGNAEDNFRIGLKKSRQIKWYLTTRRGIKRSLITAISRGESSPIEDNSSNWGRKKNNRIEIIVD